LPAAAAAVLMLAAGVACGRRVDPPPKFPPPLVEVAPVVQKNVPVYGEWVGTLEGFLNANIQPQVTGYLIRQDYHEGSLVRKDQVLFQIDPRPFKAVLDQAKGQLAQAEANLAKDTLDVNRDIPEAKAHAIPQSQLDNDRQAQLAAKATVEADKAAVETAALNLGYTKVRSLIGGIAGITTTQVGNLVGPSSVLTAVSQVNPIKVYFPISEQEYMRIAGRIAPGAVDLLSRDSPIPLQLILPGGETYPFHGRILFADRQVNPQTGTINIVGAFPNPRDILRPGLNVRVRALTEILKGALLVPQSAVTQLQGSYQVTLLGPGNRAQLRTVGVGPMYGQLWVITSGLKLGDQVIAQGAQKVREGEPVRPEPYHPMESK
jgi:membrane fusion protein (multidrug efflux system)